MAKLKQIDHIPCQEGHGFARDLHDEKFEELSRCTQRNGSVCDQSCDPFMLGHVCCYL